MLTQGQTAVPALRFQPLGVPVELRVSFLLVAVAIGLPTHLSPGSMLAWVVIATVGVLVHEGRPRWSVRGVRDPDHGSRSMAVADTPPE